MRRGLPLLLLGTAATVLLHRRLAPRPALPPGPETVSAPDLAAELAGVEAQSGLQSRFRRARIDIVTVVDDLLGSVGT